MVVITMGALFNLDAFLGDSHPRDSSDRHGGYDGMFGGDGDRDYGNSDADGEMMMKKNRT